MIPYLGMGRFVYELGYHAFVFHWSSGRDVCLFRYLLIDIPLLLMRCMAAVDDFTRLGHNIEFWGLEALWSCFLEPFGYMRAGLMY